MYACTYVCVFALEIFLLTATLITILICLYTITVIKMGPGLTVELEKAG